MLRSVAGYLAPGGRFVATNAAFWAYPAADYRRYGIEVEYGEGFLDGASYGITFHVAGGEQFTIHNYILSHETYEEAFRVLGFKGVRRRLATVTDEGIRAKGAEYWRTWLENPPIVRFEALV